MITTENYTIYRKGRKYLDKREYSQAYGYKNLIN